MILRVLSWFLLFTPSIGAPHSFDEFNQQGPNSESEPLNVSPKDACWEGLTCSLCDIESMGMVDRLEFMKYLSVTRFSKLSAGDEFPAIEGFMDFFIRKDLAGPGTWLSLINAAVIESVEQGVAISLGLSNATYVNPGSHKWAGFFDQRKNGKLTDRVSHDLSWAIANQAAIDYGTKLAKASPNLQPPSERELRWLQITGVQTTIMRRRRGILWVLRTTLGFTHPVVLVVVEAIIDWMTDVTDAESASFLAEIAWKFALLGFSNDEGNAIVDSDALMNISMQTWEAFKQKVPVTGLLVDPKPMMRTSIEVWKASQCQTQSTLSGLTVSPESMLRALIKIWRLTPTK
ncbi:hypothetical protein FQN49_002283 [Arthroderma sp. PD_2]|nr:hypothetical protein FQN49_002283 [Arthroderma sp. PD_2]